MTLNCNGKILDLQTKKIMGIINLSQDSFYDGGKYDSIDKVNAQISNLVSNGAEIIDIGAASSKPGSKLIDPKKELYIVSDYIIELSNNFRNIHLSIDVDVLDKEYMPCTGPIVEDVINLRKLEKIFN